MSEGGVSHGLQETVSGNRWSQTPLRSGQPGFCCGAAALGHRALSDDRSESTEHEKSEHASKSVFVPFGIAKPNGVTHNGQ